MAYDRWRSLSLFCLVFIPALIYECDGGYCAEKEDCKWFGTRNRFLCHCNQMETTQCDHETGACPNGECTEGWFGPGCLYRRAEIVGGPSCKEEENNQKPTWNISIIMPQKLTWLRLTMLQDVSKEILEGFLFDYESVSNEVREATGGNMVLDNKTVDYSIPVQELVKSIVIKGEGVGSLCSVDISNGWNVAIGEPQVEGSNIKYGWIASGAVDGGYATPEDNATEHVHTCVHINELEYTEVTQDPPVFTMNFSIPVRITEVKIYNRLDRHHQTRLNGFTLQVYNDINMPVYTYKDSHNSTVEANLFTVPIVTDDPVYALNLSLPNRTNILNFCEIEAYGEKICDGKNKFGFMCEYECHCLGGASCFFPSGACPGECEPGWGEKSCHVGCTDGTYGISCLSSCSINCVNSTCDIVNGYCTFGCIVGWTGDLCNTPGDFSFSKLKGDREHSPAGSSSPATTILLFFLSLLFLSIISALYYMGKKSKKDKKPVDKDGKEGEEGEEVEECEVCEEGEVGEEDEGSEGGGGQGGDQDEAEGAAKTVDDAMPEDTLDT